MCFLFLSFVNGIFNSSRKAITAHAHLLYLYSSIKQVQKALYERGYILIVMGGGITGFTQANGSDLHHSLNPSRPVHVRNLC